MKWSEAQVECINRLFADTKNDEILNEVSKLGAPMSLRSLLRIARGMGLNKTEAFMKATNAAARAKMKEYNESTGYWLSIVAARKQTRKNGANNKGWFAAGVTSKMLIGEEREQKRLEKAAEARRQTIAREKRRIELGLEQKTNLNLICRFTKQDLNYRYVAKKLGYIVFRGEETIYYDKNVQRDLKFEERLKKHDIVLIPLCMRGKKLKEYGSVIQSAGNMRY